MRATPAPKANRRRLPLWVFTLPGFLALVVGLEIMDANPRARVVMVSIFVAWAFWAVRTARATDSEARS